MRWALAAVAAMATTAAAGAQELRVVYYPVAYPSACPVVVPVCTWSYYYYAAAPAVVTVPAATPVAPPAWQPVKAMAPQRPAPASPEPIQSQPRYKPSVSESRSPAGAEPNPPSTTSHYFDTYFGAGNGVVTAAGGRCSATFWNLTGRPVRLEVGGRTLTLAARQQLALELPRSFTWQADGRGPESTQVPDDQGAAEVLIRQ